MNNLQKLSALYVVAIFSLLFATSCATKNTKDKSTYDIGAVKPIIEEKTRKFTEAHITGDTSFLNNIFTEDARIFAPGTPAFSGRDKIAAINSEFVGYGIKMFKEETTSIYGSSEYVIQEGNYLMQYGKENTLEKGKFIYIWKLVNGDWKLYANIWNTSK